MDIIAPHINLQGHIQSLELLPEIDLFLGIFSVEKGHLDELKGSFWL
jgi:hypothetical protein